MLVKVNSGFDLGQSGLRFVVWGSPLTAGLGMGGGGGWEWVGAELAPEVPTWMGTSEPQNIVSPRVPSGLMAIILQHRGQK